MSSTLTSILLPVYNGERYLRECISSVLAQDDADFEVLIRGDCSSDNSQSILREYVDPRLRLLASGERMGLFGCLNELARNARGSLVRFLCQDDVLEVGCLLREQEFFACHPSIAMAFCKTVRIDCDGRVTTVCRLDDLPAEVPVDTCIRLFFYHGCIPGNLSTVTVRREHLLKVGRFDESYGVAADYEMWVRLCCTWPLGVIQARVVRLRHHQDQLSRKSSSGPEFVREGMRIRSTLLPRMTAGQQSYAARFARWRFSVLDFHLSLKYLLGGQWGNFCATVTAMGLTEWCRSTVPWVLTFNNRLFRPKLPPPDAG